MAATFLLVIKSWAQGEMHQRARIGCFLPNEKCISPEVPGSVQFSSCFSQPVITRLGESEKAVRVASLWHS